MWASGTLRRGRWAGGRAATPGDGLPASCKTERPGATRPSDPAPRRSPTGAESCRLHGDPHTDVSRSRTHSCSESEAAEMFFRVDG